MVRLGYPLQLLFVVLLTNTTTSPCKKFLTGKLFVFLPLEQSEFIIPAISSSLVLFFVNLGDINLIRLQEDVISQI